MLAGITQEAERLIEPAYEVHPAVNWYFMIVSTFLNTGLGWRITTKVVAPRLGPYNPDQAEDDIDRAPSLDAVTPEGAAGASGRGRERRARGARAPIR